MAARHLLGTLYLSHAFQSSTFEILAEWWEVVQPEIPKEQCRTFNGVAIYIMWKIWNERSGCIFQNATLTALQVTTFTKEDIDQRRKGCLCCESIEPFDSARGYSRCIISPLWLPCGVLPFVL